MFVHELMRMSTGALQVAGRDSGAGGAAILSISL
jgi:hypothetical protein